MSSYESDSIKKIPNLRPENETSKEAPDLNDAETPRRKIMTRNATKKIKACLKEKNRSSNSEKPKIFKQRSSKSPPRSEKRKLQFDDKVDRILKSETRFKRSRCSEEEIQTPFDCEKLNSSSTLSNERASDNEINSQTSKEDEIILNTTPSNEIEKPCADDDIFASQGVFTLAFKKSASISENCSGDKKTNSNASSSSKNNRTPVRAKSKTESIVVIDDSNCTINSSTEVASSNDDQLETIKPGNLNMSKLHSDTSSGTKFNQTTANFSELSIMDSARFNREVLSGLDRPLTQSTPIIDNNATMEPFCSQGRYQQPTLPQAFRNQFEPSFGFMSQPNMGYGGPRREYHQYQQNNFANIAPSGPPVPSNTLTPIETGFFGPNMRNTLVNNNTCKIHSSIANQNNIITSPTLHHFPTPSRPVISIPHPKMPKNLQKQENPWTALDHGLMKDFNSLQNSQSIGEYFQPYPVLAREKLGQKYFMGGMEDTYFNFDQQYVSNDQETDCFLDTEVKRIKALKQLKWVSSRFLKIKRINEKIQDGFVNSAVQRKIGANISGNSSENQTNLSKLSSETTSFLEIARSSSFPPQPYKSLIDDDYRKSLICRFLKQLHDLSGLSPQVKLHLFCKSLRLFDFYTNLSLDCLSPETINKFIRANSKKFDCLLINCFVIISKLYDSKIIGQNVNFYQIGNCFDLHKDNIENIGIDSNVICHDGDINDILDQVEKGNIEVVSRSPGSDDTLLSESEEDEGSFPSGLLANRRQSSGKTGVTETDSGIKFRSFGLTNEQSNSPKPQFLQISNTAYHPKSQISRKKYERLKFERLHQNYFNNEMSKNERQILAFFNFEMLDYPEGLEFCQKFCQVSNLKNPEQDFVEYLYLACISLQNKSNLNYSSDKLMAACILYYKIIKKYFPDSLSDQIIEVSKAVNAEHAVSDLFLENWEEILQKSELSTKPKDEKAKEIRIYLERCCLIDEKNARQSYKNKTREIWSVVEEFYVGYSFADLAPSIDFISKNVTEVKKIFKSFAPFFGESRHLVCYRNIESDYNKICMIFPAVIQGFD